MNLKNMLQEAKEKTEAMRNGTPYEPTPQMYRYKLQTSHGILTVDAIFLDGIYQSSVVSFDHR